MLDRAAGDLNTRTELTTAVTRETSERRSDVENLTRMVSQLSAGSGVQFDSKRIWYFDSSVEGWGANGGSPTLVEGWLRPANHASDAFVTSPRGQDVQGAAHRFVKLRIRKVGSPAWDGRLLWNGPGQSWDNARMVQFAEPSYDSNGIATLDVDNIPWNGTIVDQIRLDLSKAQTMPTTSCWTGWRSVARRRVRRWPCCRTKPLHASQQTAAKRAGASRWPCSCAAATRAVTWQGSARA